MRKYSITTKKGDLGTTGLIGNRRISKADLRPETYGTLDEAAAFIGLARAKTDLPDVKTILRKIQNHLYFINSELACPHEHLHKLKRKIGKSDLESIEAFAGDIENKISLPRKFVLYGESEISAYLDVARAVIRRAERRLAELSLQETIENPFINAYLNRLSDLLFLLARYEEFSHDIPFAHPAEE